jgi:hypothetical protein
MKKTAEKYTILNNCQNWHLQRIDEATDEHVQRYHRHQASLIGKRVALLEAKLGLKDDRPR